MLISSRWIWRKTERQYDWRTNKIQSGQTDMQGRKLTCTANRQQTRRKVNMQGGQYLQNGKLRCKADRQQTRRKVNIKGRPTTFKADKQRIRRTSFLLFFYLKLNQSSPCHQLVMFNFFLFSSNILYSFFVWPHFFLLALFKTFNWQGKVYDTSP